MDISATPAAIAVAVVLLTLIYYWIKNSGLFPGPKGVPYLGLYPFLTDENAVQEFEKYKKKYGDIFSFTYTGRLFINLCSIRAMRELHLQKSDCFFERFQSTTIVVEMVRDGTAFLNGEPWKIMRKYFIQKFKDYGLFTVRDDLAGPVYDSLNSSVEELKAGTGKSINIVEFLCEQIAIPIRKVIFGEKGISNEDINVILMDYGAAFEGNGRVNNLLIGPLAKLLFCIKPSFRKNLKHVNNMKRIIEKCIKRIESHMNDEDPTCIVEEYYKERNVRRQNADPLWKFFSDKTLVDTLFQFVGDGILSVAAFIAEVLNLLVLHPEEQEKLYSEIMDVIGPNRQPSIEDRANLPYTNAFLSEFIRTSQFLLFMPSLECTKETTVRGYRIPAGSITVLNFWSAHHDPQTFKDPESFNPSRYLNSSKSKAESPVIFGMGRRMCTGEPFVMLQTFLFLTTIVKNFKVASSKAAYKKSAEKIFEENTELIFIHRKEN